MKVSIIPHNRGFEFGYDIIPDKELSALLYDVATLLCLKANPLYIEVPDYGSTHGDSEVEG